MLVAIDKFTKWIEYKPITKLSADQVVSFICDILHRFGFPNTIIMDLGSNFHSHEFWEFCECSAIEVKYVSVAHLRANGQVERANSMILDGLKKRLQRYHLTSQLQRWAHPAPLQCHSRSPLQPYPRYVWGSGSYRQESRRRGKFNQKYTQAKAGKVLGMH
jgi:hypothetical protein